MTTTPTPLEPAPASLGGDRPLYLKREDVHELGAFKWRGALPVLSAYREAGADTVVTASTGNHGAATAWAAERVGLRAIVYAPEGATQAKLALIEGLGAEMRLVGADLDEAKEEARSHAEDARLPFFEDGAEPAQYEGYGAIADELLDQLDDPPAAVVVPVGNGALLGGIGMRVAARSPETLRIGVAAKEAPVMAECWQAGSVVTSDRSAHVRGRAGRPGGDPPRGRRPGRGGQPHAPGLRARARGGRGRVCRSGPSGRGRRGRRARRPSPAQRRGGCRGSHRHRPQHRR